MKLPLIRHLVKQEQFDEDFFEEANEVLLSLAEARGITDNEIEVIGELLSNIEGAIEVKKLINNGASQKDALNDFMKRVMKSVNN